MDYQDREVNIVLMLEYIAHYWKCFLLVTIFSASIGAGVGSFKYKSELKSTEALQRNPSLLKDEMEELYKSLSEDEKDRVNYIIKLNDKLTEMEDYIENGVLMNVDPFRIQATFNQYSVFLNKDAYKSDLAKISVTNQIRNSYVNFTKNGKLATELIKIYYDKKIDEEAFNELVEVVYEDDFFGNASFTVSVKEVKDLPDLNENVNRLLKEYSKKIKEKTANHELELLDISRTIIKNDSISDFQETIRTRYDNTRNAIRLMKSNNELSDNVITYYEYKIGEDGYHLKANNAGGLLPSKKKTIVKYFILAGTAGIVITFVALALYYLLFVFSKYIVSKDDYGYYNLKYIGDLKKGPQMNIVVSKICKYCSNNNSSSIAIVSTVLSMIPNDSINILKQELNQKGLEVIIINEENMDNSEIDDLLKMDHCVLIEKINSTKIDNLNNLVNLCCDSDINIVGVVGAE